MSELLYPYQNLSLKNIKGEKWKPLKGYEGYYEISSYGRVKSVARERVLHHGGIMPIAEKMLRSRLGKVKNKSVGDFLFTLIVTLNLDGIKYYHSVARLVYNAFVSPIELKDRSTMISYKDGDGRNIHYKNLFATNIKELSHAANKKGRAIIRGNEPVSQFDIDGKLIAQYASMEEAGKKIGANRSGGVSKAASEGGYLYKGFVWQKGYSKRLKKGKLILGIEAGINKSLEPDAPDNGTSKLPSANLSLKNLKGEKWKDFPGYEGLYKISNYGRVKSLARITGTRQRQWHPERIKKLTASNRRTAPASSTRSLMVAFNKDHTKKHFYVARYVYYLFVEEFDLADANLRIYYKDGNAYNPDYRNLMLKNAAWSITGKQA